ncbi:hypothetical protein FHR24_002525 [Wenyingzhuangia heitensis]|uniref:Secretion system C-terminal sorting domain-containing protein n=1 Tax=Wenyingzhuangia heitensis TaxID=1487859 RepID=A0ABX0UB47_9FLAO|nr:T9SS type A sorting domain-containing protein [Wenyingzhuangia heitensis]NIJ46047.1 hypothetical protein [Wenyingzhuangia heitensis]
MKHKKTITNLTVILLGLGGVQAQENMVAVGGEIKTTGGTVNYSVGQVFYTNSVGSSGSVEQGVNQPYTISSTLGVDEKYILLELSVYPNPTTDFLNLKLKDFENVNFQLMDLLGRQVETKKVTENNTLISMSALPKATYFLSIVKNNQIVKTFKIIKN